MKNNTPSNPQKIIELFTSLSTKEVKKLAQFLQSPYFTRSRQIIKIFQYLKKHHHTLPPKSIELRKVHNSIFSKETFNAKRIRDLLSDLSILIEQFLILQKIQGDKIRTSQLKMEVFEERSLYNLFEKEGRELNNKLENRKTKDATFHLDLMRLNEQQYLHPETEPLHVGQTNITNIMKNLDSFYILSKMRYACELISRSKTLQEDHDNVLLLDEVRKLAVNYNKGENKLIEIYRMLIDLLLNESYDLFKILKQYFYKALDLINEVEKRAIFQYLVNHSTRQINIGKEQYKLELFNLYKTGLPLGFCFLNNKISHITFVNIVVTSSGVHKFKWTKDFMEQYQTNLNERIRDNTINFAKAMILFNKGRYFDILSLLDEVEPITDWYKLWIRSLKLRTLYEIALSNMTYSSVLENFLQSFEKYIRKNNTFSEASNRPYLNYISIVKKLKKQEHRITDKIKAKLIKEVIEKDQLIARAWLLEKIKKL